MRETPRSDTAETARRSLAERPAGSIQRYVPGTAVGLEAELAELKRLSLDDLRLRWRNHWGRLAPAPLTRSLLYRFMAYRLQAQAFGDLNRKTIQLLERQGDKMASNGSPMHDPNYGLKARDSSAREASIPATLKPGTLLTREWRGRIERVMVVDDGFAWNGATYSSLSAAAFAITGTKWNGHRFFGVRDRDRVQAGWREGHRSRSNRGERSSPSAGSETDYRPLAAAGSSPSSDDVKAETGKEAP